MTQRLTRHAAISSHHSFHQFWPIGFVNLKMAVPVRLCIRPRPYSNASPSRVDLHSRANTLHTHHTEETVHLLVRLHLRCHLFARETNVSIGTATTCNKSTFIYVVKFQRKASRLTSSQARSYGEGNIGTIIRGRAGRGESD